MRRVLPDKRGMAGLGACGHQPGTLGRPPQTERQQEWAGTPKQHGSKGSHVFRDPNEEDRVWVLFDWDAEGWQSFVSDPEVPPILQEAGHKGKPQAAELGGQYDA